ncbi:asparagine synthase (glutamine-hydrolyzing) [Deltaproteobacteria bacterium OttesenSCG-928-K17]|nr:asparagine synthase (glutamine-hydrolyzing) [Deltaproteobacteria bacterium OttesenSCG-928-K17]
MCGLAGILNLNGEPASAVIIKHMAQAIKHRGPDDDGYFTDGPVSLGHCRLAILDLSPAGRQPMSTPNGELTIIFNGEIYNYQELRLELESLGRSFRSNTDTEVLLQAYEAWGEKCLDRLNGMFAFAVWRKSRRELFLARDRYGIKPLYYTLQNQSLFFGSEQKAFLAHPKFRAEIDHEALLEYFTFQNIFTDKTFLKNVRTFPAGHFATISAGAGSKALSFKRYWDFNFSEPQEKNSDAQYAEELERLFRQAVSRQMVSDVELGTYLSGGLDSGAITAIAAGQMPNLKSFTCGCDLHSASGLELTCDEREAAEHMSYLFKTEHYEMVLKAGDMERVMTELAWGLEEPRVGQSYPNYFAAKLASKFVKVVLSGAGGDELFAGYPWRYYRAAVNSDFEDYIDKYYIFWQRLLPNSTIKKAFQPIWGQVSHVWTRDIFRDVFKTTGDRLATPEDYINHSLYFEAKTFLHGLLMVEDKLSMAHGLETRLPFLDNDLVDFAQKIPIRLKLRNLAEVVRLNENEPGSKQDKFFSRTRDGKLILRQVMSKFVPKEISQAVKRGFGAPDASWFKGDSIDFVRAKLYKKTARIYDYLDYGAITGLMDEHLSGAQNRRLLLWSLLSFEHWLACYNPVG